MQTESSLTPQSQRRLRSVLLCPRSLLSKLSLVNIDANRIAREHGSAIARFVDNDALSLFTGFSQTVTAASTLTINDVLLAQYAIYNSECPNKEVPLKVVLSHRGHLNIKQEITQSGAALWTKRFRAFCSWWNSSG